MKGTVKVNIRDCNSKQCKTCIFREGQQVIPNERMAGIIAYLCEGVNHVCHTTNKICRGARDYQLQIFHRIGIISEPSDEALYAKNDEIQAELKSVAKKKKR